jgi:hypothetical protein
MIKGLSRFGFEVAGRAAKAEPFTSEDALRALQKHLEGLKFDCNFEPDFDDDEPQVAMRKESMIDMMITLTATKSVLRVEVEGYFNEEPAHDGCDMSVYVNQRITNTFVLKPGSSTEVVSAFNKAMKADVGDLVKNLEKVREDLGQSITFWKGFV